MTVQTDKNKENYIGTGSQTVFPYTFLVLDSTHMTVYLNDVLQSSGYTVDGIGNPAGGNVTFSVAPADQVRVTLLRVVPQTQLADYTPFDRFPAEQHEAALDVAAMGRQQNSELLTRAITMPPSDAGANQLPTRIGNQLKFLGLDNADPPNWFYSSGTQDPGADASFMTVTATGGNTSRTLADIHADAVNVLFMGAVADGNGTGGGTDNTAAIQSALDIGGHIFFPGGRNTFYRCDGKLTVKANTYIDAPGGAQIDFTNLTETDNSYTSNSKVCFLVGATTNLSNTFYNFAANANVEEYTATLTAGGGANFSAGDWVLVTSNAKYDYNGSTFIDKAEIKKILSVSTDVLTFENPLYDNYTTADTGRVAKITFTENVTFRGLGVIGTNTEADINCGILTMYCRDVSVENCRFKNIDFVCLNFTNTIESSIRFSHFDGVLYTGSGNSHYGILFSNCAQWCNAVGNHGNELRHLVTTSSTANHKGQPYHCTISANVMRNAMAGGSTFTSYAYEAHGFGRFLTWVGNNADGCFSGINVEIGDQVVVGNHFINCSNAGVLFGDANTGRELKNIIIADNYMHCAVDGRSASPYGILFPANANSARENISITGNIIRNFTAAGETCGGMRINAGSSSRGVVISNNIITKNVVSDVDVNFGIRCADPNVKILDNRIKNYMRAVYVEAANVSVQGNTVAADSIVGSNNAIQIAGVNKCTVICNEFRNVYRAIRIDASSDATKVAGNTQYDTTSAAVSDLGTNTLFDFGGTQGF